MNSNNIDNNGWLYIYEKEPESIRTQCLCVSKQGEYITGYIYYSMLKKVFICFNKRCSVDDIEYWRPLPERPKRYE